MLVYGLITSQPRRFRMSVIFGRTAWIWMLCIQLMHTLGISFGCQRTVDPDKFYADQCKPRRWRIKRQIKKEYRKKARR